MRFFIHRKHTTDISTLPQTDVANAANTSSKDEMLQTEEQPSTKDVSVESAVEQDIETLNDTATPITSESSLPPKEPDTSNTDSDLRPKKDKRHRHFWKRFLHALVH